MRVQLVTLCLALATAGCIHHPPTTAGDVDASITRADFADWLSSYALETKRETISKSEKNGIVIVEYDWLGDDGELAIALHSRIYWTKSPAGVRSSIRMSAAKIPPRTNITEMDTRYRSAIRLWSTVRSHDRIPYASFR